MNKELSPQNAVTAESRRLKITGLVLMLVAFVGIGLLSNQMELKTWQDLTWSQRALGFVLCAVAVNFGALGLFLLLAGLRRISFRDNPRARRGLGTKMIGANFFFLVMFMGILSEEPWFQTLDWWLALPLIPLFVFIATKMISSLRRGWKYDAISADELLRQDTRAPVVYLRSFKDDAQMLVESGWRRWMMLPFAWIYFMSPEQELAAILRRVGPVIAIGKPGEPLPELGAARLYASDDEWQGKVTDFLKRARLVVLRWGATANLRWELDQAVTLVSRERLVLLFLGDEATGAAFLREMGDKFGAIPPPPPRNDPPLLQWMQRLRMMKPYDFGQVLFFVNGEPRVQPVRPAWAGWRTLQHGYRRFQVPLEDAFRPILTNLGVSWTKSRNHTIAILLALFLGMYGAHWFYLGQKRRGWRYVAFALLLISFFLGLRDAVRLALMSDEEFAEMYPLQGPEASSG